MTTRSAFRRRHQPGTSAAFNLATLGLSLYFDDAFAASPWPSTASAGTSGGRSASEATNPPTAGVVLGGKASAAFNGTTQLLTASVVESAAFTAAAGGIMLLIRANAGLSAASGSGAVFDAGPISGAGGYFAIGVNSTGCSFTLLDAAPRKIQIACTHDGATWHAVFMRWNGTLLEAGVDGGALSSLACGNMGDLSSAIRIGNNAPTGAPFPGQIRNVLTWASTPSDADRANVRTAWNTTYGLAV